MKKEHKKTAIYDRFFLNGLSQLNIFVLLTSKPYYEFLMPYLQERFGPANVKIPMDGMRIGERLRWLKSAEQSLGHSSVKIVIEGRKA